MGWRGLEVRNNKGFTLIELMITMLVFSVIIAAVYATHISQQRTYQVQGQVTEIQQNIRAALYFMTSDIRMAGYDPTDSANFGITIALAGRLQFTVDTDDDGTLDADETFDIGFSTVIDADGNGIPDTVSAGVPVADRLGKQSGGAGGYQALAENIQAVEFLYLNAAGVQTAVLANIRSVQVTILARAGRTDPKFNNTMTYTTPSLQNWGPYNDTFRRRLLTTTIRCRNL